MLHPVRWLRQRRLLRDFRSRLPLHAGKRFARGYQDAVTTPVDVDIDSANPLQRWFADYRTGPGVHKWLHYFPIYHRHFSKFVGRELTLLEIGIAGGGSLGMWRDYFGPLCHIVGVDIDPSCRRHEETGTRVFIGDQRDRGFWRQVRAAVPAFDIVIDDGGHTPEQQRTTLEELLPAVRPGGVYLCEDVHGTGNGFIRYTAELVDALNHWDRVQGPATLNSSAEPLQRAIDGIHFYPYVVVLEKAAQLRTGFHAPRHGTEFTAY